MGEHTSGKLSVGFTFAPPVSCVRRALPDARATLASVMHKGITGATPNTKPEPRPRKVGHQKFHQFSPSNSSFDIGDPVQTQNSSSISDRAAPRVDGLLSF
jgi:hypothetical protein